jgi:hypothetical protein
MIERFFRQILILFINEIIRTIFADLVICKRGYCLYNSGKEGLPNPVTILRQKK